MCLALYLPPKSRRLTLDVLEGALLANPDGFGLMYSRPSPDGPVLERWRYVPTINTVASELLDRVHEAQAIADHSGVAVHWRLATHGAVTEDNAHPQDVHPGRSAIIHNGIIAPLSNDPKVSDTQRLATQVIRQLPKNWHHNAVMVKLVESFIGKGNKVVFMTASGEVVILNDTAGYWEKQTGWWLSNYSWHHSRKTSYAATVWKDGQPTSIYSPRLSDDDEETEADTAEVEEVEADFTVGMEAQSSGVHCVLCLECAHDTLTKKERRRGKPLSWTEAYNANEHCDVCGEALAQFADPDDTDDPTIPTTP